MNVWVQEKQLLSYHVQYIMEYCYWVPAWRDEHKSPDPWSWLFSPYKTPRQMVNRNMYWRRPTYEETLARQKAYSEDPEGFLKKCERHSRRGYYL